MKTNKKLSLIRWMLAIGVTAALAGGTAYAMNGVCMSCKPCGCSSDGGQLMCCDTREC
jgi:hypothetical protein